MRIGILLFDRLTALDAIGPYEVLSAVPGWDVDFFAEEPGPKRTDTNRLALVADHSLADARGLDMVLVPGGAGNRVLLEHEPVLSWLREVHEGTRWTTSVCTGSLLLGAAGLLQGKRATSIWLQRERLREYGAQPAGERVVVDGKIITAAGVSAGIDMALHLVQMELGDEAAQAIQLGIEYDPQPPFQAGSPEKAPPAIVEAVRAVARTQDEWLSRQG